MISELKTRKYANKKTRRLLDAFSEHFLYIIYLFRKHHSADKKVAVARPVVDYSVYFEFCDFSVVPENLLTFNARTFGVQRNFFTVKRQRIGFFRVSPPF